jgi:hypothetical protein
MSGLYLVVVAMFVALQFPQPEGVQHTPELLKRLSPESQALLLTTERGNFRLSDLTDAGIEVSNGAWLPVKKGVSEKQMTAVAREYSAILSAVANERRISFLGAAVLWSVGPCAALYFLGLAIGWVRRGFRSV